MPAQSRWFENLLEAVPDSLVGMDPKGTIRFVNRQTESLFGYDRDQLIGQPIEMLVPASLGQIYLSDSGGQSSEIDLELSGRQRDGIEFPINISLSHIDTGDVLLVITPARDVTHRREAFEAARSMIESSLDSLVAISPEGKITDANQATVKVTGVSRAELIGTSFSEYFTEPDNANRIYRMVFAEGMAVDYPLTMRHKDGTLTEVLYNASVYRDGAGSVLGVFAAARDVTKQVHAQKEIAERQAWDLERLAELERFQRLTVGRELKMIELKKEIESLRMFVSSEGETGDQS
jgi:PAS domain S-box-containing protein